MKKSPPTRALIQRLAASRPRCHAIRAAGISISTFYRYARHYGVETRRTGSSYVLNKREDDLIHALHERGLSARTIGDKLEVSHTTILKRLRRRQKGTPSRSREER